MRLSIGTTTIIAVLLLGSPAAAQDNLRELITDRPDQTESPYTVDAGHFQLELDLVNATFDRDGRLKDSTEWSLVPFNFKAGLLNRLDVQVILDTFVHRREEISTERPGVPGRLDSQVDVTSGVGELTTRLKLNLWGDDGGRTAFGVMPYIKWPTSFSAITDGRTEGGVILPLAIDFGRGWSLGVMTEFDFLAKDSGGSRNAFVNSASVGRELSSALGMYFELVSVSGADVRHQAMLDAGVTYGVGRNAQFDAGCNFGVSDAAPDVNPFVGFSVRF